MPQEGQELRVHGRREVESVLGPRVHHTSVVAEGHDVVGSGRLDTQVKGPQVHLLLVSPDMGLVPLGASAGRTAKFDERRDGRSSTQPVSECHGKHTREGVGMWHGPQSLASRVLESTHGNRCSRIDSTHQLTTSYLGHPCCHNDREGDQFREAIMHLQGHHRSRLLTCVW